MNKDMKQMLAERGLDVAKCIDCAYYGIEKIPFEDEYGRPYMEDGCLLRAEDLRKEGRDDFGSAVISQRTAMYEIGCEYFVHKIVAETYRKLEEKEERYNDLFKRISNSRLTSYELRILAKEFSNLGFQNSSALANECERRADEKNRAEKRTKRIIQSILIIVAILAIGLYIFSRLYW